MTENEIPAGTRAVMFCFTTDKGTPRVTLNLFGNGANKTFSQMQMLACDAVIQAGHKIVNSKAHFIK